jgi:predicted nucleic acid-binding protein
MLVADTNVLIELFLPTENSAAVQQWRAADKDWQLPDLWVFEFRHILLKYMRAERLDLDEAIANLVEAERLFLPKTQTVSSAASLQLAHRHGCSSYDAEFVVLAKQLNCPLLTYDRKLLQLFPDVALKPGS